MEKVEWPDLHKIEDFASNSESAIFFAKSWAKKDLDIFSRKIMMKSQNFRIKWEKYAKGRFEWDLLNTVIIVNACEQQDVTSLYRKIACCCILTSFYSLCPSISHVWNTWKITEHCYWQEAYFSVRLVDLTRKIIGRTPFWLRKCYIKFYIDRNSNQ